MTIGEKIRLRREELLMTQDSLAQAIGCKTRSSVSKIECGERDVPRRKVEQVAKILGLSPAYLMGFEDTTPCDEDPQIEPVKYKLNGIDALAVLEHGLEDWLGIKGKGEPTAEAELVSIGAYPEYAELTFKHNDNTYAFVFRKENK